jgi:hypothetical protein
MQKGDVIDLATAKKKSPFTRKKLDRSKMDTKTRIDTALQEQAEAGSPYAEKRTKRGVGGAPPPPAQEHPWVEKGRQDRMKASLQQIDKLMGDLKATQGSPVEDHVIPPPPKAKPSLKLVKKLEQLKIVLETLSKKKIPPRKLSPDETMVAEWHSRHEGIVPEDHPDRPKIVNHINKINQIPGQRGEAFRLHNRFISPDNKYTKNETLTSLIKGEVFDEWTPRFTELKK